MAREHLSYSANEGVFRWKTKRRGVRQGSVAGCNCNGYVIIIFLGVRIYAHRLAWLYEHGEWPRLEIDHINNVKNDNRISNLRLATSTQNKLNRPLQKSNKSGHRGVFWRKQSAKWVAIGTINKKIKHLGSFKNIEDAINAYERFSEENHGQFAAKYGASKDELSMVARNSTNGGIRT